MSEAAKLVSLDAVSLSRRGRQTPDLDAFSLLLREGEVVVLLGEEESGADAVLRTLAQAVDRDEKMTGEITYRGTHLPGQMRIAYLPSPWSRPLSPNRSVAAQLSRVIARRFSIPRAAAREELRASLAVLKGAPPFEALLAKPEQVDQSVIAWALLATVVAQSPELILADDPVRGLSPTSAHAITAALLKQRERLNAALLYNARALDAAIWASGRIVVMRQGRVVEEGSAERLASGKSHAYTQTLFRALPKLTMEQPAARKIARGETLLRVQGLVVGGGERAANPRAADKVSFELRRGASLALLGEEGSGRRSLVRMILGLDRFRTGRVILDSVDLGILSDEMTSRMRRRIAFITGADDALDPRMTVRDTVDEPLRAHLKLPRDIVIGHREQAMKRVGLASHTGARQVSSLSNFDKRRLQVARAIVSAPMLTVIEEPLLGLDAFAQTIMRELLTDFRQQEGSAFLLITSDLAIAQALSDEAIVFHEGRMVARGPVHELLNEPKEAALKSLIASAGVPHAFRDAAPEPPPVSDKPDMPPEAPGKTDAEKPAEAEKPVESAPDASPRAPEEGSPDAPKVL
jgi:peptide/nickel transport system ATP-binding protein